MRKEIFSHYQTIYEDGPWTLEEFNKLIKGKINEIKKAHKASKPTKILLKLHTEHDYDGRSTELRLDIYREETTEEQKRREQVEEDIKKRVEKLRAESKRKEQEKKKKEKERNNDPDYVKYKELQGKLKKKKLI